MSAWNARRGRCKGGGPGGRLVGGLVGRCGEDSTTMSRLRPRDVRVSWRSSMAGTRKWVRAEPLAPVRTSLSTIDRHDLDGRDEGLDAAQGNIVF